MEIPGSQKASGDIDHNLAYHKPTYHQFVYLIAKANHAKRKIPEAIKTSGTKNPRVIISAWRTEERDGRP